MKTLIALLAFTVPAQANGVDLLPHYETPKVEKVSHVQPKKATKAKAKKSKSKPKPAYSFRPPPQPVAEAPKCYEPITVVGSQWAGEGGAYESAVKAAKEAVRWKIGEMAMDPANWQDVQRRCSMSSVGEIVGQTFHRCEIRLTPCRPGMVNGGAK
jgi:hypothetical protein